MIGDGREGKDALQQAGRSTSERPAEGRVAVPEFGVFSSRESKNRSQRARAKAGKQSLTCPSLRLLCSIRRICLRATATTPGITRQSTTVDKQNT